MFSTLPEMAGVTTVTRSVSVYAAVSSEALFLLVSSGPARSEGPAFGAATSPRVTGVPACGSGAWSSAADDTVACGRAECPQALDAKAIPAMASAVESGDDEDEQDQQDVEEAIRERAGPVAVPNSGGEHVTSRPRLLDAHEDDANVMCHRTAPPGAARHPK